MMNNATPVINLLWTGGWDSTYRLLILTQKKIILQPHYIICDRRRSVNNELNAIEKITEDIVNDSRTKCDFLPTIIIKEADIPPNEEITNAFNRIRQQVLIGPQYEYLSRYAHTVGNLEIGIEKGGLAEDMINKFGKINYVDKDGLSYWELDRSASSEDLITVFGGFRFPIYTMSKLDMKEEAEKLGVMEIMEKNWFCHFPYKGLPCGSCFPCKFTIEDGLAYRLPKKALRRYKTEKKFGKYKIYQRMKRLRRKWLHY